jgi:hypothetical protein
MSMDACRNALLTARCAVNRFNFACNLAVKVKDMLRRRERSTTKVPLNIFEIKVYDPGSTE